ncbi:ATP-dependent helicase [Amycolatopsis sp. NPDC089917]|uniref:ATP-dependent helicase n=1 Tax=Amycolatopsis sp. NPDC089917 TaxID=3155187 RepID=UPI003412801F
MIRKEDWQPVDGLKLEPNALTAVTTTDRNVVVAAGPGAGKTELLAQRADFLLRTGACPYPRRILAISFKVDAARNLRDRVRTRSGRQYAARFDSFTFHAFAKRLIDNYRVLLTGEDALDPDYTLDTHDRIPRKQITFDDLVPLALEILGSSRFAGGALRQTYSHVFLDEFQDATKDQYELVSTAFLGTEAILTAVGDVKQRIMVWAGALHGIMKKFADDFNGMPLPLYQNFRSAPRLRRMQNRMIKEMDLAAASPDKELVGDEGVIQVLHFDSQVDEAEAVADLIEGWLTADVPPSEIAVLVRQKSQQVTEFLGEELHDRGIPYRNEQDSQDLAAEPAAALIFNFIRVITTARRPDAYAELMRVAARHGANEEAALQFDSQLKRLLRDSRATVCNPSFAKEDLDTWRPVISAFLELVSRPVLNTLAPAYQQGTWLDDVIENALEAFGKELAVDGDPVKALKRLAELDAVRVLTIHKCKGLEFEKVVVLGVEQELFWGDAATSEFFVAISRAKNELVLTHTDFRARPSTPVKYWREYRTAHSEFLAYADDGAGDNERDDYPAAIVSLADRKTNSR